VKGGGKSLLCSFSTVNLTNLFLILYTCTGMPGAFTTTCTTEHLPGYIASAEKFKALGISKIAVVTTNDRFVNEKWGEQLGLTDTSGSSTASNMITILSDGDGDLVKNLGLADDMGFGIGTRSKRFVMVVDKGTVSDLFMDDGMDDCTTTSAANLITVLTPDPSLSVSDGEGTEISGGAILGIAAVVIGLLASQVMGGSSPSPAPAPSRAAPAAITRPAPSPSPSSARSDGSFPLLNQYMKKD
jgi:glutaredoxin/glutathione-dependent peroxiredoxin